VPHRRHPRHRQRTARQRSQPVGTQLAAAPWWPRLLAEVTLIVRESGDPRGFDAPAWLVEFLSAPSPALGGRTPATFMQAEVGRAQVTQLIRQMQSGAYA
jgi:hypothetical protein